MCLSTLAFEMEKCPVLASIYRSDETGAQLCGGAREQGRKK